jgi:hypothetical protein
MPPILATLAPRSSDTDIGALQATERPLADVIDLDRVRRRDRLGGLIHEYELAA